MWDLPKPGIEPMSPALAGRFLTTEPSGKPLLWFEIKAMQANRINWGVFPLLLVSKTISERLGYFFFMYLAELISDDIWTPKF